MHFDHFIRAACIARDLDWRKYRRASRRRVLQRIRELGLRGYGQYLRYLDDHPEEAAGLPNLLRVTVSRFFRDRDCWRELARETLPGVLDRSPGKRVRALSVGSCGGEEPYSLALAWEEWLRGAYPEHSLAITGIELDEDSLARARRAVYQERTLREVPQRMRDKWFRRNGGDYLLHPVIRNMVVFRRLDFLNDPLPEGFDLILCRYLVFTYFLGTRQRRAVERLRRSMGPGGVLMIGKKEGLGPDAAELFRPLSDTGCLFAGC
jgi:chemotaxis methyl-accepting protein methylase